MPKNTTMCSIILLTTYFPYGDPTQEPYLLNEINHLSKNFKSIKIIALKGEMNKSNFTLPINVSFHQTKKRILNYPKAILNFIKYFPVKEIQINSKLLNNIKTVFAYQIYSLQYEEEIRNIKPNNNTIYYSYWLSIPAYTIAKLKKKDPKIITISRAHGYDAFISRGYLPFRIFILKNLNRIYFISANAKNKYEEYAFKKNANIKNLTTAYLGTKNNLIQELKINSCKEFTHLVSCSKIIPIKRLEILVKALLLFENTPIKWTHFGDGPSLEGIKYFLNKKQQNIIVDFRGSHQNEKIIEFYEKEKIDLFINTSSHEGIPVSIMEAQSFGIPAIGFDVGGINEILNNENGFLLPENGNEIDLYNSIKKYLSMNLSQVNIMRNNSQKNWSIKFNCEINYPKFCKELGELIIEN